MYSLQTSGENGVDENIRQHVCEDGQSVGITAAVEVNLVSQ